MTLSLCKIAAVAAAVTTLGVNAAAAQWYSSASPQAPYAPVAAGQPYAVEVSPGAYIIHRPDAAYAAPPRRRPSRAAAAPRAVPAKNDPASISAPRQRPAGGKTASTTRVVYEKPKVVVTRRYVDDPPRVVNRYTVAGDSRRAARVVVEAPPLETPVADKPVKGGKRVIQADAEITVLGPDRMTIQLYRKGERGKAVPTD